MTRKTTVILSLFLLMILSAAYLTLYFIPRAALFQDRTAILATPASVGLHFEDVELQPRDEPITLAAWWIPAASPVAKMVFVHGGGSNRTSEFFQALDFYRAINARGVSVLTLDLRNHGESDGDGQGLKFGANEYPDVLAAIEWLDEKSPNTPLLAMGKSMGGATVIHAAARGARLDGLVLLDPALDTQSALINGIWAGSGIPRFLLTPAVHAATSRYDLPEGGSDALELATGLELPILIIQDPDDPVTVAGFARELASRNRHVSLWEAPPTDTKNAKIAGKGRWGSHVAAFHVHPDATLATIMSFIKSLEI
ncbi:MAG: alpha/beta fold hydrolase [Halioglobus sp.]